MRALLLTLSLALLSGCGSTLADLTPAEFRAELPAVSGSYTSLPTDDEPGHLLLVPAEQADMPARPDGGAERALQNLTAQAAGTGPFEVVVVSHPTWPQGKQWPSMQLLSVALFDFPLTDEEEDLEDAILSALEGNPCLEVVGAKAENPGVDYATARFTVAANGTPSRYLVSCFALDKAGAAVRRVLVLHSRK